MIDESTAVDPSTLSPRAAVALLTLQLRSTLQEAVDAESEAASMDVDAALWQLRSKLEPLFEDRRRALQEELRGEQERADAAVAAARVDAAQIVAEALARADAARVQAARAAAVEADRLAAVRRAAEQLALMEAARNGAAAETHDVVDGRTPGLDDVAPSNHVLAPPPRVPTVPLAASIVADADATRIDQPLVAVDESADAASDLTSWAADAPLPVEPRSPTVRLPVLPVDPTAVGPGQREAMHVVIDAESFAKAFAAALAPVIEARNQAPVYGPYPPGYMPAPASAPKRSFWAHAWHPDVLLSGLAMVIVIIVLIAWTG